jgi:transforming growth factor-beta-induced protein
MNRAVAAIIVVIVLIVAAVGAWWFLLGGGGGGGPTGTGDRTVVEMAQDDGNFSILVSSLNTTNLTDDLNGTGPFTVFAPTDEAFGEVDQAILEDEENLSRVLRYHVVADLLNSSELENGTLTTLEGSILRVVVNASGIFVNDARVIQPDINCSNGVIHKIDRVLIPPMNIVDTLYNDTRFSNVTQALNATGLNDTLNDTGPFTVFAPQDSAFAELNQTDWEEMLSNESERENLTRILQYHVVDGAIFSNDLNDGMTVQSLEGSNLVVIINETGTFVNNAMIVEPDILCSNGVIHVIDRVLVPMNVVETLASDERFSTLYSALLAANLTDDLNGTGPFTLFAPTNDAFAMIPPDDLNELLNNETNLTRTLQYHVVEGMVLSSNVTEGNVTTLEGSDIVVVVNDTGVFVNDAQVIITDIICTNGVIHGIDQVLMPPEDAT